jgi:hypothetical protein
MGTTGRKLRNSAETAPRAAASHFSGDLDRQARLTVEGRGHDGHASDIEAVLCTQWALVMETRNEEKPHGH